MDDCNEVHIRALRIAIGEMMGPEFDVDALSTEEVMAYVDGVKRIVAIAPVMLSVLRGLRNSDCAVSALDKLFRKYSEVEEDIQARKLAKEAEMRRSIE